MDEHLNPNQISASQLYAECTSEDHQIQNHGYEILWRYLYSAALYLVAQDLAQIALEKVFKNIHKLESPDAFKSWARQILRNGFINWYRKEPQKTEVPDNLHDGTQVEAMIKAESSDEPIEYLFNCSQGQKVRWAWIGRYHYGLHDNELAAVESLLCKRHVSPSTFPVARAKSKAQWIEVGLIDKLLEARFDPIDPTDPDAELNDQLQKLLIIKDWDPLYQAPFDEGSRWSWIGRHIYEADDEDLARVENLLCKTSIGARIMQARRSRVREELKPYLLNLMDV